MSFQALLAKAFWNDCREQLNVNERLASSDLALISFLVCKLWWRRVISRVAEPNQESNHSNKCDLAHVSRTADWWLLSFGQSGRVSRYSCHRERTEEVSKGCPEHGTEQAACYCNEEHAVMLSRI